MKTWIKVAIITIIFAIPTFLLGRVIWPSPVDATSPTSAQLPFFIIMSVIESLAFGLGISFAYLIYPTFKKAVKIKHWPTILSIISLIWWLVSWWPHDNLHRSIGMSMQKLLYIEYGFHFTLIVAALILAYSYYRAINGNEQ